MNNSRPQLTITITFCCKRKSRWKLMSWLLSMPSQRGRRWSWTVEEEMITYQKICWWILITSRQMRHNWPGSIRPSTSMTLSMRLETSLSQSTRTWKYSSRKEAKGPVSFLQPWTSSVQLHQIRRFSRSSKLLTPSAQAIVLQEHLPSSMHNSTGLSQQTMSKTTLNRWGSGTQLHSCA